MSSRPRIAPAVVALAALASLAACASSHAATRVAATATPPVDSVDAGPPIVQVRDYPGAANVAVLAWAANETAYGLRADVNADGALTGTLRAGDHRLFVSTVLAQPHGGFRKVTAAPEQRVLPSLGIARDDQACRFGAHCAPLDVAGFDVPDALLRANRDSLVVRFQSGTVAEWSITLRRPLIDAYLAAVDSVSAARRTKERRAE